MPTIHKWISTDGDGANSASWSTGEPPAVAAVGTLTFDANAVAAETVTIDARTYTWVSSLGVANDVLVGADPEESRDNLVAAINDAGGGGYHGDTTIHPTVTASGIFTGGKYKLVGTAKIEGTAGNSIATTETMTQGSWGGATLSGGTQWTSDDHAEFNGFDSNVAWSSGLVWPTSVVPGQMKVGPGFTVDTGAPGSPLFLGFSQKITYRGAGDIYYAPPGGSTLNFILDTVEGRAFVGHGGFAGQTINFIFIKAGEFIMGGGSSMAVGDIYMLGAQAKLTATDAACVIAGNVYGRAGYGVIHPLIAANKILEVTGATIEQIGEVNSDAMISVTGGLLQYKPIADTSSTPDIYIDGGILDLSETRVALTFGNTIVGPRGAVVGGSIVGDSFYPPNFDFREEWP